MCLAVANEHDLAIVFLKQDFQHNNIFGISSSFLVSHDEIITNITSKEISTTRLSEETQHLHRQTRDGLWVPEQGPEQRQTLPTPGDAWPPLRNDPSRPWGVTTHPRNSLFHSVGVSIAVKMWSHFIHLHTVHSSVNIHTAQFPPLRDWESVRGWPLKLDKFTSFPVSFKKHVPASTLVGFDMCCPVFSACPM